MGTATTNVVCKSRGIASIGIEANDYFIGVGKTKLEWDLDGSKLDRWASKILGESIAQLADIDFELSENGQEGLFSSVETKLASYKEYSKKRPKELLEKYICDRPLAKLYVIHDVIEGVLKSAPLKYKRFFGLALSSIIVPASNISYGPGFGVKKPKVDVDVYALFRKKLNRMVEDVKSVDHDEHKKTKYKIIHGDARQMSKYLEPNSVDLMITSPPYPGDHEYTKHTKLELIFENFARDLKEFRVIKKRMLTGSTTNIYKEDNDRENVLGNSLIEKVTSLIQERLDEDNATSGFEKLYTKLVWEYFGGMAMVFREALIALKKGGKFSLLVSDSHAFKMVHIQTAEILKDIALKEGFSEGVIVLWQNKPSTSHGYNLREDILTLTK
tara:strand:- start:128 stop:1285 length:1158 start_codon:yes stop_codon:yes gene_type:complete